MVLCDGGLEGSAGWRLFENRMDGWELEVGN